MTVWLNGFGAKGVPVRVLLLRCFLRSAGAVLFAGALAFGQNPADVGTAGGSAKGAGASVPIAIVPIEASGADQAATVTGALQVTQGKAIIASNGTVTSGSKTTEVVLPRRGVLRVCASTTVKLASDGSLPSGETPGLMMALDHGAVEASFATGRNSDILLTPDFRILIGGPGAADVKVRLGQHGDTCVDNAGVNAPYVLVTSIFGGGAYRVQPGQRVMFQHGSLQEVVDQEKEPCGCPSAPRPGSNDFPLAESAGLTPLKPVTPAPQPSAPGAGTPQLSEPLVYKAPTPASNPPEPPALSQPTGTAPSGNASPAPASAQAPAKKRGFFRRVGGFFKRIFGAD